MLLQWFIPDELDHWFPSGNLLGNWNIFSLLTQGSLPLELFMVKIGALHCMLS